jgi:3'-5' exoribonuclease
VEKLWVKDVQVGQRAAGLFLVARKQQLVGKNEKAFLKLTLQDKTGSLDARVWNAVEELGAKFEANDLVQVDGKVDTFQGRPQLTVEAIDKASAEAVSGHDPNDFVLVAPEPPAGRAAPAAPGAGADAAIEGLRREVERVGDPHVRALLGSFLDDPELAAKLRRAPAAREIHHAYPGGLAEHLLSCVRLAGRLADHYPMVDRDLVVAGAFLHDVGKAVELDNSKGGTVYTDEGKLVGHLVITAQWIHERAKVISGFPKDLELHLTHLVLAHHGRLEYGSPKPPMTLEAFLVHELDEIDSRMNAFLVQMAREPDERWAEPQKPYQRELYKGPAPTEAGRRKGPPARGFGKLRGRKRREMPAAKPEGEARAEGAPAEGGAAPGERPPRPPRRERGEHPERRERKERPEGAPAAAMDSSRVEVDSISSTISRSRRASAERRRRAIAEASRNSIGAASR